jgi:hypothetical protein
MAVFQHAPSRKSIAREQGKDWERVKLTTALNIAARSTPKGRRTFLVTTVPKRSWRFFTYLLGQFKRPATPEKGKE